MPIVISCSCGKQLRLGDDLAGKKIRCPECKQVLLVEETEAPLVAELEEEESPPQRIKAEKPTSKSRKKKVPIDEEDIAEADRDEEEEERKPRRKKKPAQGGLSGGAWIGIGAGILVLVLAICGGGLYLMFGSVGKVREAAARSQSANNLTCGSLVFWMVFGNEGRA